MTSCLAIMGPVARGVGNIDVGGILQQLKVVEIFNVFARRRHTL